MFSGIVQTTAQLVFLEKKEGVLEIGIALSPDLREGLAIGASVSLAGVCLTVATLDEHTVYFDVMKETLEKTYLGDLHIGDAVNIERSISYGEEIGGHLVSGHVMTMAKITNIEGEKWWCTLPQQYMRYLFPKGFIAMDGCSLTVVDVDQQAGLYSVALIPETLSRTTFGTKKAGDRIHIEIDQTTLTIVETLERMQKQDSAS